LKIRYLKTTSVLNVALSGSQPTACRQCIQVLSCHK